MASRNLKRKLVSGLAGIVLGVGVGGCADMTPEDKEGAALWLTLIGAGAQSQIGEPGVDSNDAAALSNLAYTLGNQQAGIASSQYGKDEVNVNVGGGNQNKAYSDINSPENMERRRAAMVSMSVKEYREINSPENVDRRRKLMPIGFALSDYLKKETDPEKRMEAIIRNVEVRDYIEKERDVEKIREAIRKYLKENPHINIMPMDIECEGNPYYYKIN